MDTDKDPASKRRGVKLIRIVDLATARVLHSFPTTFHIDMSAPAFSSDGTLLAWCENKLNADATTAQASLRLWSAKSGELAPLELNLKPLSMAFASNDTRLVVSGPDSPSDANHCLEIWNVPERTRVFTAVGQANERGADFHFALPRDSKNVGVWYRVQASSTEGSSWRFQLRDLDSGTLKATFPNCKPVADTEDGRLFILQTQADSGSVFRAIDFETGTSRGEVSSPTNSFIRSRDGKCFTCPASDRFGTCSTQRKLTWFSRPMK